MHRASSKNSGNTRNRITSLLIFSTILFLMATTAKAQDDEGGAKLEIVRISSMQGDVRLSRGDGKRADLDKPWEVAEVNIPMEVGFAIATGTGRAEIEFENGSMIYLADNSLVVFEKLEVKDGVATSAVRLNTGTLTISFEPGAKETLAVHTPTDEVTFDKKSYLRVDSFLDATSATPLGEAGEDVIRHGQADIHLQKGQTITTYQGHILSLTGIGASHATSNFSILQNMNFQANPASGLTEADQRDFLASVLQSVSSLSSGTTRNAGPAGQPLPSPAPADWDNWVGTRLEKRKTEIAAALKESGLTAFVPGLTDLYEQGVFFPCAGYGQCWEPKDQHEIDAADDNAPEEDLNDLGMESVVQTAGLTQMQNPGQVPGKAPQNPQPNGQQTAPPNGARNLPPNMRVEYVPMLDCSNRVLRITYEIDPVTHKKREVKREEVSGDPTGRTWPWAYCYSGDFVRVHRRYALVARRAYHHPPVRYIKIGKKVCYVPRHPHDGPGKPPVNLKHGVFQPTGKNGGTITHVAFNPQEKFKLLEQAPKGFQPKTVAQLRSAERPLIVAHNRSDNVPTSSSIARGITPGTFAPRIQYDYKSHQFMQAGQSVGGHTAPPTPVGTMNPHGTIQTGRIFSGQGNDRSGGTQTGSGGNQGGTPSASHGSGGGGSHGSGGSSGGGGGSSGGGGGGYSGGGGGGGGASHGGGGGSSSGGGGGSSGGGGGGGGSVGGGGGGGGSVGGGGGGGGAQGGGGGGGRGH
jgi:hypothetical protein